MPDAYEYIDPDHAYTDPKTGVLRNLADIAEPLAALLDSINHLHPFREGNGRVQREFIRILALEKGYTLNLNPPDNLDVYERYMSGTINGNVGQLADLILGLLRRE